MTNERFEAAPRSVAETRSRRATLAAFLGGLPSALVLTARDEAAAKNKQGKKNQRRKKRPCRANDKPGKTCRCKKPGGACTIDANCCPGAKPLSCQQGTCQPCDVCRSGCEFTSVQAAIDAATAGATIHLCGGTFEESLRIEKDLTLVGVGEGEKGTTLYGSDDDAATVRVIDATVTLERLRITSGFFATGGIFNDQGTLTLRACTVSGNSTVDDGGGIATRGGRLILTDTTVADNQAQVGGGIRIVDDGEAILTNSIVRDNTAAGGGGGIAISSGTLTLIDSRVERNTAGERGGGIFRLDGTVTFRNTIVINNSPENCEGVEGCV